MILGIGFFVSNASMASLSLVSYMMNITPLKVTKIWLREEILRGKFSNKDQWLTKLRDTVYDISIS